MKKLKLLVAEGNVPEENEYFKSKGIRTHTESLKESILNYYSDFEILFSITERLKVKT